MADKTLNDFLAVPKGERVQIALDASYQIEALMSALVSAARSVDSDGLDQLPAAVLLGAR